MKTATCKDCCIYPTPMSPVFCIMIRLDAWLRCTTAPKGMWFWSRVTSMPWQQPCTTKRDCRIPWDSRRTSSVNCRTRLFGLKVTSTRQVSPLGFRHVSVGDIARTCSKRGEFLEPWMPAGAGRKQIRIYRDCDLHTVGASFSQPITEWNSDSAIQKWLPPIWSCRIACV